METALWETDFRKSDQFFSQNISNIQDRGAWGQILICIKWHAPITRLTLWQQSPIAELLVQVFLAGICAKVQVKYKSGMWFRDSFQKASVLRSQGHSPDKDNQRAGNFAGVGGSLHVAELFWKKLPGRDRQQPLTSQQCLPTSSTKISV